MTLPCVPYGFADLDPDSWIQTPELAARMGYCSITGWYADAKKRLAANFPKYRRRGFWRIGEVIEWDRSGGLSGTPHKGTPEPAEEQQEPIEPHSAKALNITPIRPMVEFRLAKLRNQE